MGKKNICASCIGVEVTEIMETDNSKIPQWLESIDYVSNFIDNVPLEKYEMEHPHINLTLNVGKSRAGKLMLYWGAESSDSIIINDALDAYGNFSNYGVTKVNKDGKVNLFFNCPQPYSTIEMGETMRETFYRHMHFCFSNKAMKKWLPTVYTKIVICNMKTAEMLNKHQVGDIVLLNTMRSPSAQSRIPNSYNLFHTDIDNMSREELIGWMTEVVESHYPKLDNLVKQGQLAIYELPIVVYCANKKCPLSEMAAIALYNKGFVNVRDYEGGMRGYNSYMNGQN